MEKIKAIDNFVDDATCDHMVAIYDRLFESVNENYDGRRLIRNTKDPEIVGFLQTYIGKINKMLDKNYYIRDLLMSIYPPGAYVDEHVDFEEERFKDNLGVLFYFNDDFEGGELEFKYKPYKIKPKAGMLVSVPVTPDFTHRVSKITSGNWRHSLYGASWGEVKPQISTPEVC